jgi:hypothetical protein
MRLSSTDDSEIGEAGSDNGTVGVPLALITGSHMTGTVDVSRLGDSAVPHSMQNLAPGGLIVPQLGQPPSRFPHSRQNLAASGFNV